MGGGYSQQESRAIAQVLHQKITMIDTSSAPSIYSSMLSSIKSNILLDVGIDESLLKYSDLNSNYALKSYYKDQMKVPEIINKLTPIVAEITPAPNAVGLGALVISMVIELCITGSTEENVDTYSLLQRVFGEEKASSVRDTMTEYLKRHRMLIKNQQRLLQETQELERQLSGQLTVLRNSLLHDGQMSTRGLKIWVNGASFHLQMMIHEARLQTQTGQSGSDYIDSISAAISVYLQDLDALLKKFKTFKTSVARVYCSGPVSDPDCCYEDSEFGYVVPITQCITADDVTQAYLDYLFSNHKPITGLKPHFSNIKRNLNSLINQHDSFTRSLRT